MVADSSVPGAVPCPLSELRVRNFRCLTSAEFRFDPGFNVFTGSNGAGKTSILEAIYVLGRARSFRTAERGLLIQSGYDSAELIGVATAESGVTELRVRIAPAGLEIQVGGETAAKVADLATGLPIQVIHSDIGHLIEGPPEGRRRLLDWGVFHVEHRYLGHWRRYRRALAQRNAALREGAPDSVLDSWDQELTASGDQIDEDRRAYVERLATAFRRLGERLLGMDVSLDFQRGWPDRLPFSEALLAGRETDRSFGYTRAGPHRCDLVCDLASERSRWRASRGQQKLLASALVLAQCDLVAEALGRPVVLLVDEPAADLDREGLTGLLEAVRHAPAQIFLAALSVAGLPVESPAAMFHVEHGRSKALL